MERNVLVVDDEINILKSVRRVLSGDGYTVHISTNAVDALEILSKSYCSVILSDLNMPKVNGIDFLKLVKKSYPNTKAIIFSGSNDFETAIEVINSGIAHKFIRKPWLDESLLNEIRNAFDLIEQLNNEKIRNLILLNDDHPLIEFNLFGKFLRYNSPARAILKSRIIDGNNITSDSLFPSFDIESFYKLVTGKCNLLYLDDCHGNSFELSVHHKDKTCIITSLEFALKDSSWNRVDVIDNLNIVDSILLVDLIDKHLELNKSFCAAVYISIKNINEIQSCVTGDVVIEISSLLGEMIPEITRNFGVLSYLHTDNFILFVNNVNSEIELLNVISKIVSIFNSPVNISGVNVNLSLNIGYSLYPEDATDSKTLIDYARQASRCNASLADNSLIRYDSVYVAEKKFAIDVCNSLQTAIEQHKFSVKYQPKIKLPYMEIVSAEILLRFDDPLLGSISPTTFIPIAEKSGQIHKVGAWVLEKAITFIKQKRPSAAGKFGISVNVSAIQLKDPFFIEVAKLYSETLSSCIDYIELEITESSLLENVEDSVSILNMLKSLGYKIALDDFGTGYSSFFHLSKMPLDVIKIDRSLVSDIDKSASLRSLVRNIIRMASDLNIEVVAEGIETEAQLNILEGLGCVYIQGYLFSKPVSDSELISMIETQPFVRR